MSPLDLYLRLRPSTPYAAGIGFDEPSDRVANAGLTWPFTVGYPLAQGTIDTHSDLVLATSAGDALPTQTMEALPWHSGDGSPKWVLLDGQADFYGGGTEPALTVAQSGTAPEHDNPVEVTSDSTTITVATGGITAVITKATGSFTLYDVTNAVSIVSAASIYWTDTDGNIHVPTAATATIEKTGPLRAVIKLVGSYANGGTDRQRFIARLHFFAGLPYFKIHHTLILDQHVTLTYSGSGTTGTTLAIPGGAAMSHGWNTPDSVLFKYTTGAQPTAVNNPATTRYIRALTASTFSAHPTADDATNNVNALNLATGASGVNSIVRTNRVVANYGIKFTIAGTVTQARFDVDGDLTPTSYTVASAQTCHAVQTWTAADPSLPVATLTAPNASTTTEDLLAGWADARTAGGVGLAVSVQDMMYATPSKILVSDTQINPQFWGGPTAMSMINEDRLATIGLDLATIVVPAYNTQKAADWLGSVGEANPFGIGRTTETWCWPALASVDANRLRNDMVQRPPVPVVAPDYACSTGALGHVAALSELPTGYTDIEDGLAAMFDFIYANRDGLYGDYDFWTFGDVRLFRNGWQRMYGGNGYKDSHVPWLMYATTGGREYYIEGMRNARHVMDVDTCQIDCTSATTGSTKRAGVSHIYAPLHWAWIASNLDHFVDHADYLMYCYCMTGYERAKDVLDLKAAGVAAIGSNYDIQSDTSGEAEGYREQYGKLNNKAVYYEWTGTEGFLESLESYAEWIENTRLLSAEEDGLGSLLPSGNYFFGMASEGMEAAWDLLDFLPAKTFLMNLQLDYATAAASHYASPSMECTNPPSRLDRGPRSLQSFAFAYDQSGDTDYLGYAIERVRRQCLAVQRTAGTWYGYEVTPFIQWPTIFHQTLRLLASWRDAGYATLPVCPANNPVFLSYVIADGLWLSRLTFYVTKLAGVAVNVKWLFKTANLVALETFGAFRVVQTNPDTSSSTTNYNTGDAIIEELTHTISAGSEAGQYKLVLDGEAGSFSVAPRSDATQFVLELNSDKDMYFETFIDAAKYFIKLASGQTAIAFSLIKLESGSTTVHVDADHRGVRPLTVLDKDGALVDRTEYDQAATSSDTITIPLASRTEVISLLKGHFATSPTTIRYGLRLGNCERYISPTAAQWFVPV